MAAGITPPALTHEARPRSSPATAFTSGFFDDRGQYRQKEGFRFARSRAGRDDAGVAIAHAALEHLQLVAVRPEQRAPSFILSADQATADELEEDRTGTGRQTSQHGSVARFLEEILKAATIQGPLGLGFQQGIGAQPAGVPQQLTPFLGKNRIFDAEGRIEIAEIELSDAAEGADGIVHGGGLRGWSAAG